MASAMTDSRELRTEVSYDVRVWGMDSNGKPFAQTVEALNVSRSGARLVGLRSSPRPADVIGVQCGNEKARFRVVWVGKEGTPEQGHIGVAAVDGERWIWGTLGTELQVVRPPNPSTSLAPTGNRIERRRHPRYKCCGVVQIRTKGSPYATPARLPDLSLGGCYAESMSPYPIGTEAELELILENRHIVAEGVVRTLHANVGNGIEFTSISERNRAELAQMVADLEGREKLAARADEVVLAVPAHTDALVKLLQAKLVLTRAEYLRELAGLRAKPI